MEEIQLFEVLYSKWISKIDIDIMKLHSNSWKRRRKLNKIFNKNFFNFISNNKLPANRVSKYLLSLGISISAGSLIDRAKRLDIKLLSISESSKCPFTIRDKIKKCQEKYGVDNPSQSELIKKKKERKAIKKYGVKNVFQAEEIKNICKQTILSKYGVEYTGQIDNKNRNYGRRSRLQRNIEKILIKNNISFTPEKSNIFFKYNKILGKNYCPIVDILLNDAKIVIEVNGDIWHTNPKLYKEDDIIYKFRGPTLAKDIWKFDNIRKRHIESFGYKVIIVWEKNYKHNRQKCENTLIKCINKYKNRFINKNV